MIKHRIKVTREDIEAGVPLAYCDCPVACAMLSAGFKRAMVGWQDVSWFDENAKLVKAKLPPEVTEWILLFDGAFEGVDREFWYDVDRDGFEPFEFELEEAV